MKVLDFGIAKALSSLPEDKWRTGSGVLVGTLAYMAPEQLRGNAVHVAWDLWALAVIALEMLMGSHVVAGPSALGIDEAPTGHPAALPELADTPLSWQSFFVRALSLDPARRPESAGAFLLELEQALDS